MVLDKLIGLGMLAVAIGVFVYYTTWVFVLPFVDETNCLNSLFLPRDYAIKLPVLLLLIAGVGVGSFVANVLIKNAEKERLKNSKKSD
jgi:dolichyl-phosphate mannosyltransferase polypeptide 2 regulatory subunit